MDSVDAVVSLLPLRSNLVNLPGDLVSLLYSANINVQEVVIELSWRVKRQPIQYAYAGWSGMTSASSMKSIIEIDPVFANSLGIVENSKVTLTLKFNVLEALKIHLEPISAADWELVELHAQFLEDRLLNQSRAVKLNQTLVVYPSANITANLKVVEIVPTPTNETKFAKISPNCEVIIAPKLRKTKDHSPKSVKSIAGTRRNNDTVPKFLLRNICLPHDSFASIPTYNELAFQIYLNYNDYKQKLQGKTFASLSVIPIEDVEDLEIKKNNGNSKSKTSTQVVAKVVDYPNAPPNYIGITKIIAETLKISNSNGNLILMKAASPPLSQKPRSLIIHPFIIKTPESNQQKVLNGKSSVPIKEKQLNNIRQYLAQLSFFNANLISNHVNLPVNEFLPNGGSLEFKLADGWFVAESVDEFEFEMGLDILRKESEIERILSKEIEDFSISIERTAEEEHDDFVGYDVLVDNIIKTVNKDINGILIQGSSGSGKSLLIKELIKQLFNKTTHKLMLINLEDHLNEAGNFDALKKTFNKIFSKLVVYEKVILIIENINLVCYKQSEQGFNDGTSVTNNFTEYFVSNFFKIVNNKTQHTSSYDIKLILTSNTKENLNSVLLSNSLLINEEFKINAPDKSQRAAILNYYITKKNLEFKDSTGVELNDLLNDTEGYLPSDLKTLVDRAYHEVVYCYLNEQNAEKDPPAMFTILPEHFQKAFDGFTPSGLRNIKLQQSKVKWDDIGGLKKAKEVLLETLEWPTKYAPIFANCPLRLRSGILLYGYPGCGKTLLASAVSSQCGLNFISVKGPEILNKYIGASEQSVRELFERASAAKPCILFFDEFDSIAPKRGHDSTGVTDRVVNQMLTQMDGAEGLDGVYVLAATSRPDLIDSALLRPGRLDKSVICDIPDFENRLDILQTVTNKMKLEKNINLELIAEITQGFSGADLQALCYNAYLNSVHRKLKSDALEEEKNAKNPNISTDEKVFDFFQTELGSKSPKGLNPQERAQLFKKIESALEATVEKKTKEQNQHEMDSEGNKDMNVFIKLEDLEYAVKETSPSISVTERQKLQKIYKEFISDRDGNMPDGAASNQIGGRTTLM